ncbi:MAG: MG2 domain-containing protein [Rubritalea sp.]|uniref:alpha-2-macroglobulin family protein n=1 Tax=Rubritalea sp. TaxID=2109375 RepID=UPI003241FB58
MKVLFLTTLLSAPLVWAQPILNLSSSELLPETRYELVFEQPVVSKDQLNQPQANAYLKISPKLKGQIVWTQRNIAQFLPSEAPKLGTNYTFSTTRGISYENGKPIPTVKLKTSSTPDFKTTYHRRYSKKNNRMPYSYLRFNDDIKQNKVETKFYYINKEGTATPAAVRQAEWADLESTYYIKPSWQQRFQNVLTKRAGGEVDDPTEWAKNKSISNGLIVTPKYPLSIGEDWVLVLKKNTPNASASDKTKADGNYHIWDIDPFNIDTIIPAVIADRARSIYVEFSADIPEEFDIELLKEVVHVYPTPKNLGFKRRYNNTLQITGDFQDRDDWKVTIDKEFNASNGLMLGTPVSKDIKFHYVPSGLAMASYDSAQLAKGDRSFKINTVNMREVRVQIKSLNNEQAIRATQGYRHYSGNGHDYRSIKDNGPLPFELISGTAVYDEVIQLDNAIDTSRDIHLSWDEILPSHLRNATLFISVTGQPKAKLDKKASQKRRVQSLVQLTDIGLAWKLNDKKAWVYAYSLNTGKPLSGVELSMYGEDAKKLHSATTDTLGLAVIDCSKNDRHLIARTNDDQFTVTFDKSLSTVSMWRFPVDFNWASTDQWQHKVMLFTDRNLYRPGETVRLKGIVREFNDNAIRKSGQSTMRLSIRDPRNKEVTTTNLSISKAGGFNHSFTLPTELVGSFTLLCTLTDEEITSNKTFSHRFQVQDFRRNAFVLKPNLPAPSVADKDVQFDIEAKYYQGTPVAEGTLHWYASSSKIGFYPEKFRDFQFGDHRNYDPYYWSHYFGYGSGSRFSDTQHSNGTATLSAEGTASITAAIPQIEFPAPQHISITGEVTDSRDQTLSSVRSTTYFPADYFIGIQRSDALIRVGNKKDLNIVAVDTKGEFLSDSQTIDIEIEREYYESVKILAKNGTTKTHNEKRTEKISSEPFQISAGKPTPYAFSPQKSGRYIFTLNGTDIKGHATRTASSYYVYGSQEYPWATEDGHRIKLVSEQKSYKPGDTARILVMTPIEGTALVTVERQGIIESFRRELKADKPVLEFPISENFAPNAFVSVLIIRGSDVSPRKFKQPALKLGFCEIIVSDSSKELVVSIDKPSSSALPGQEITLTGIVKDHLGKPCKDAEIVLFAEDEGTLAVMGFSTPDPLKFFHSPLQLSLRTGVSLGYFIDDNPDHRYMGNKGFTIGGGGLAAKMMEMDGEAIQNRTNFDPCAAWFPSVTSNSEGRFSATFKTPDTLTRYRIIAIAHGAGDQFGSAESSFLVNKDIMLEPKPPRFAHEGDSLITKVLIENTSNYVGTWDITLKADSLCSIPEGINNTLTQTIQLKAHSSATLSYPVSFINTGETTWTWSATPRSIEGQQLTVALKKQLSDGIENTFNVAYPRPLLHQADFARLEKNTPTNLVANMTPIIMNGRGHMDLEFSNSLLLEAGGASEYLLRYPYGCVEQTTSSLIPWFAVSDLKGIVPGFSSKSTHQVTEAIQKGVDRLLSMQTSDGGLAYWPGGERSEDWASVYGGMGLLLAIEQGAKAPEASIKALSGYLQSIARNPVKKGTYRSWRNDTRARALYVLSLAGAADMATQNKLYDERHTLSTSARSFLALAIHHSGGSKKLATELISTTGTLPDKGHWMRYRSDIPVQLLAWSTIAPRNIQAEKMMQNLLNQRNPQGHWRTTWVNGWAMHSMAAYARYVEFSRPDSSITLQTSSGTKTIKLTKDSPLKFLRIPLTEAQSLIASCEGKAYTRILAASKPEVAPSGPTSNDGITISRRYEMINDKGEASALGQPQVGDLIQVTLTVGIPANAMYISIDDPLPSILESVNDDFASQASVHSNKVKHNYRISRSEFRNERSLFFLNRSWGSQKQEIKYLARVTAAGTVHAPPAKAESMYNPSQYGLSEAHTFTTLNKAATAGE